MFDVIPDEGGRGWQLVDPRPMKAQAPYTFFIPSAEELMAQEPGDWLRLAFAHAIWDGLPAEYLWVRLDARDGPDWSGTLMEAAERLDGLAPGQEIRFSPWHVLSVRECRVDGMEEEARYFAHAHIDPRILSMEAPVALIERRVPFARDALSSQHRGGVPTSQRVDSDDARMATGGGAQAQPRDGHADTGWYFYAEHPPMPQAWRMFHGPIGVMLNIDDSMLPLLRAPFGTQIKRWEEGWRVMD